MRKFTKILFVLMLSAFISGQLVYADTFSGLKKIGNTSLNKLGKTIQPLKNVTGNFVSNHTSPAFGNKVKNSSWRNVLTSSNARKQAIGILKGAKTGFLSKDSNHGASIAYNEAVLKSGMTGVQKTMYVSEDLKKNYEKDGPEFINNSFKTIYETTPTDGSGTTSYFRVDQKTMDRMNELNLR